MKNVHVHLIDHGSLGCCLSIMIAHNNSTVKKTYQEETWPEEDNEVEFYMADSSGVSIEKEQLEVMSNYENYISSH